MNVVASLAKSLSFTDLTPIQIYGKSRPVIETAKGRFYVTFWIILVYLHSFRIEKCPGTSHCKMNQIIATVICHSF